MREHVLIVGSGMMGSGIGAMSALAGHKTILLDVDPARAQAGRERALDCIRLRADNGLNTAEEAVRAATLLETSTELSAAADKAFLVIEAIVENLEVKQNMFEKLDALLPVEVPLCSNTSGLRITDIGKKCVHPERTVTTHFWLPAHLVPLVEVVVGDRTDVSVAERVYAELKTWKKAPVLVQKDLPGQLANRILQAIIREASSIVEMGLASPEDVDTAVKMGMGIRFPVWGPLEHVDAAGLDLCTNVQDTVLPGISRETCANSAFRTRVAAGDLGYKTGKGFYDWSEKDMKALEQLRNDFIIQSVKMIDARSKGENSNGI